jgi:hypothetical protein
MPRSDDGPKGRLAQVAYPFVPLWGRIVGYTWDHVSHQLTQAVALDAPTNTLYIMKDRDGGTLVGTLDDIESLLTLDMMSEDADAHGRTDLRSAIDAQRLTLNRGHFPHHSQETEDN